MMGLNLTFLPMSGLVTLVRVVLNINLGGKTDTRVEEVIHTVGMSRPTRCFSPS